MNRKFQSIVICITSLLLALAFAQGNSSTSGAADKGNFLADRHQAKKIECSGCHKEGTPKAVPMAVCLQCHGSYADIAKKTDKKSPNPHASHMGEVACEKCHHGHKPSVDHCADCH